MMRFARKIATALGAKALEGDQGLVEAYCSVFNNVDYAGEIIRPGFFAETINAANNQGKAFPKILWSHSMWDQPLGVTLEAEEVLPYDGRLPTSISSLGGLRVVGKFNLDTTAGHDAFSNIKMGALDQYSIGYYVIEDKFNRETGVVELLKGDWIEWSPVNFAANDATTTVSAKNGMKGQSSEHIYIVRQPSDFKDGTYKRSVVESGGKSYTVITGTLRASGNTEEASIRFDADAWDAQDALSLCSGKGRGTFEAASGKTEEAQNGERLAEHGARMVAQVSAYLDRVDTVKALRLAEGKAGRVLSEANRTMLAGLLPDLKSVIDRVQTLLDATEPTSDDAGKAVARAAEMKRLYGRALAINAELLTIGEVAS
jgi:HK97 family phage prohead protease